MKTTKLLALTAAFSILLTSFTACGGITKEDGATLEISMDNSWRSTEMTDVRDGYAPVHAWGNCILLSRAEYQKNKQEDFQFINTETGESVEFQSHAVEERADAGNFVGCSTVIEYGDGTAGLVIYEKDRNDDVIRYCIEMYDAQMNYLRTEEIPVNLYKHRNITGWVDNQGNWYLAETDAATGEPMLVSYNSQYEKYGEIALPYGCDGVQDMVRGREDGTMYACLQKHKSGVDYYEICEINGAERTIESTGVFHSTDGLEKYMSQGDINYYRNIDFVEGSSGYDFCWINTDGLYGYKEGEETQLISWINSDFPMNEVSAAYFMDNGSVVALTGDFSPYEYYLCTPRTQEEIDNTTLISLSTLGLSDALEIAVIDYNRAENGCRIIIVDYLRYNTNEDDTIGKQKLQEDMLDGIVADMVCTDGMHFESLANKGLFGDWYDLMDADESFRREDYLQNFYHAYEYDGKLQRLGVQYSIYTAMAKTEFAGAQEGVNLEEYAAYIDSIPEGMDFYDFYAREWFMESYFPVFMNAFVDAKNAECYFDTPVFSRILGMIAALPSMQETPYMTDEEFNARIPSNERGHLAFRENRAFIQDAVFCHPIDFRAMNRLTFHDEPVTMVGIPMDYDEGNGGLFRADFTVSVNAQSQQRTAIWNFMKHLLQEEYQTGLNDSLPVLRSALETKIDEAMHMVSARKPFGGTEVQFGESNEEEMRKFRSYAEGIRTAFYFDETVYNIMMEEMEKYFAGDCTAEECAEMIQSRASIYLSEQS